MGAISYIALRRIETVSYSKTGTDISVAAADDSFNATSTNLSGLLDNQWIKTAGFANAVNNGWFQASANSTGTKIVQDTTTSLTTESAGAAVTIQGYARGYGQSYNLESGMQLLDHGRKFERSRKVALGGYTPEVLLHRRDELWNIKTDYLLAAALPQWEEFLASIAAGETFSLDAYGTIAAPQTLQTCVLEDDGFQIARVGAGLLYEISAQFRAVS